MNKKYYNTPLFRPSYKPTIDIPFGVRSIGGHCVRKNWKDEEKITWFTKLLWGIEGKGEILLKGKKHILLPNTTIIILPNNNDNALALTNTWRYRWLTIDGIMNESIVENFKLQEKIKYSGHCPEDLFIKLEREIQDTTPTGERLASGTAYNILSRASETPHKQNKKNDLIIKQCVKLIHKNFRNAELNINYIADSLKINRTTLSKEFRKRKGVSLINFLISIRTQDALSLLKRTDLSVSEIAYMTGYDDPDYFSKSIKKQIGLTPTECRKL